MKYLVDILAQDRPNGGPSSMRRQARARQPVIPAVTTHMHYFIIPAALPILIMQPFILARPQYTPVHVKTIGCQSQLSCISVITA